MAVAWKEERWGAWWVCEVIWMVVELPEPACHLEMEASWW